MVTFSGRPYTFYDGAADLSRFLSTGVPKLGPPTNFWTNPTKRTRPTNTNDDVAENRQIVAIIIDGIKWVANANKK